MCDTISLYGGNIYVPAEVYEAHFANLNSAVVLEREQTVVVLPIRGSGSGGLLLKMRNARGDRVIHAREQLAAMNIDEGKRHEVTARWDAELGGLRLELERD